MTPLHLTNVREENESMRLGRIGFQTAKSRDILFIFSKNDLKEKKPIVHHFRAWFILYSASSIKWGKSVNVNYLSAHLGSLPPLQVRFLQTWPLSPARWKRWQYYIRWISQTFSWMFWTSPKRSYFPTEHTNPSMPMVIPQHSTSSTINLWIPDPPDSAPLIRVGRKRC